MKLTKEKKYYTVIDMWQAFHSIELKEECKIYTGFSTQFGTFEYNCCPQGFLNSTDAYNIKL